MFRETLLPFLCCVKNWNKTLHTVERFVRRNEIKGREKWQNSEYKDDRAGFGWGTIFTVAAEGERISTKIFEECGN